MTNFVSTSYRIQIFLNDCNNGKKIKYIINSYSQHVVDFAIEYKLINSHLKLSEDGILLLNSQRRYPDTLCIILNNDIGFGNLAKIYQYYRTPEADHILAFRFNNNDDAIFKFFEFLFCCGVVTQPQITHMCICKVELTPLGKELLRHLVNTPSTSNVSETVPNNAAPPSKTYNIFYVPGNQNQIAVDNKGPKLEQKINPNSEGGEE